MRQVSTAPLMPPPCELQILDARKRGPPTPPVERARAANTEARFASALAAWQRTRQARDRADADAETRRVELEARIPRLHLRPASCLCPLMLLRRARSTPGFNDLVAALQTGDLQRLRGCKMTIRACARSDAASCARVILHGN